MSKPKSKHGKRARSRNAGISLSPQLIETAKAYADKHGFETISNLVRFLLIDELEHQHIAHFKLERRELREGLANFLKERTSCAAVKKDSPPHGGSQSGAPSPGK